MTNEEKSVKEQENINSLKEIEVVFDEPINGWWDGGPKQRGTFTPSIISGGFEGHYSLKKHIEWGCWELNHFFRKPISTKNNTKIAINHLKRALNKNGIGATVKEIE